MPLIFPNAPNISKCPNVSNKNFSFGVRLVYIIVNIILYVIVRMTPVII